MLVFLPAVPNLSRPGLPSIISTRLTGSQSGLGSTKGRTSAWTAAGLMAAASNRSWGSRVEAGCYDPWAGGTGGCWARAAVAGAPTGDQHRHYDDEQERRRPARRTWGGQDGPSARQRMSPSFVCGSLRSVLVGPVHIRRAAMAGHAWRGRRTGGLPARSALGGRAGATGRARSVWVGPGAAGELPGHPRPGRFSHQVGISPRHTDAMSGQEMISTRRIASRGPMTDSSATSPIPLT